MTYYLGESPGGSLLSGLDFCLAWLGASGNPKDNTFEWLDGTPLDKSNNVWKSGEPDSGLFSPNSCALLTSGFKVAAAKTLLLCAWPIYSICEIDMD